MKSLPRFLFILTLGLALCLDVAAQQPPTRESLAAPGPYQVSFYTQLPDVPEYGAATLYFPANKAASFGGVAIAPGFIEEQENIEWWGRHLASHGFAVLTLDTNTPRDNPALRAEALMAAVNVMRGENSRNGSPLIGKIDGERMAVMGHSMGGGGTLLAANEHSDQLKAAIPFTPWLPDADFSSVAVPTLLIAGEIDRIAAVADHAWPHFQTLPAAIPKLYLEIKGGNHFIANSTTDNEGLNPNMDVHDLVGSMGVAWLKLFVDGDEAYRDIVFGELPARDRERISRLER
jgi:alpha-beta hydrolase superfamily lysophospholipase